MIDQADAALERWLCAALEVASVDFVESAESIASSSSKQPTVAVILDSVSERTERRDTEVNDIRDADGRVTARQRSLRFFDVDYRVTVPGDPRRSHVVLGRLLQALVDADTIAPEHLPAPLRALEVPIEIGLPVDRRATPASRRGIGLVVRLVVPVAPTPNEEIAPPAVELHLDMSPPPGAGRMSADTDDTTRQFISERTWTTVRRREAIAPITPAGSS